MALESFQKNVSNTIQVPPARPIAPSKGAALAGGIVDLASVGLQAFNNIKVAEQKEALAIKNEGLAQEALDLNSLKLNMKGQGKTAEQQNATITRKISRFSALDQIAIREMSAERFMSGTTVVDAAERDAKVVATAAANEVKAKNSAAESMGFLSYDAMDPTTRDDDIDSHLEEQAEAAASDKRLAREVKVLERDKKKGDARKAVVKAEVANTITKLQFSSRDAIRVGIAQLRAKVKSGEITADEMGLEFVKLIDSGATQLQDQFSIVAKDMTVEKRTLMQGEISDLMTSYKTWGDALIANGSGVRQTNLVTQQMLNMTVAQNKEILSVPGMLKLVSLVDLKVQDASTLKSIGLENGVIGEQVKAIGAALKLSVLSKTDSPWASFYADEDPSSLDKSAAGFNTFAKDVLDGKIEVVGGKLFVADTTDKYIKEVIESPQPNQFRPEPLKSYTDPILNKGYESLPEAKRKDIADDAPEFARAFFGTNNTGAFVPSVNRMLEETGLKLPFNKEGSVPLWSLGVNKDTGMLEVSLAGTAQILKSITKDSPAEIRGLSPRSAADVTKRLRKFKKLIESNQSVRDVLKATAKATGLGINVVTHNVLSDLSSFSNLPVAEAFTRRPAAPFELEEPATATLDENPPAPKTGTIGDHLPDQDSLSSLDDETFEEFLKVDPRTQELINSGSDEFKAKFAALPRETQQQVLSMTQSQRKAAVSLMAPPSAPTATHTKSGVPITSSEKDSTRADGTAKGNGYFGKLDRPDGKVSTELSIGVGFEDGGREIPALVPTLTEKEVKFLLRQDPKEHIPESIRKKAIDHAVKRIRAGKSPFWEEGDEVSKVGAQ